MTARKLPFWVHTIMYRLPQVKILTGYILEIQKILSCCISFLFSIGSWQHLLTFLHFRLKSWGYHLPPVFDYMAMLLPSFTAFYSTATLNAPVHFNKTATFIFSFLTLSDFTHIIFYILSENILPFTWSQL